MSNKNLGIILLVGVLTFSTALPAFSQARTQRASSQDDVKKAKQALKEKGLYKGPVDGSMNPQFVKALRDFQSRNKLQATGKLDHVTMMKLSTGSKGGVKQNSQDQVRQVQQALQDRGTYSGPLDAVMGANTRKGIADFQRDSRIPASGQIDPQTEIALGIATVPAEGTVSKKLGIHDAPYQYSAVGQELDEIDGDRPPLQEEPSGKGIASSLEDVRKLQMALKNRGYDPGEINGVMGSDTRSAVRQFQAANNLPVNGSFDERTQEALGFMIEVAPDPDTAVNGSQSDIELSERASRKQAGTNVERSKPSDVNIENQKGQTDRTMDSMTMDMSKVGRKSDTADNKIDKDLQERLAKAAEVLQDLTKAADRRIPEELLRRAQAIAVIPHVVKGAFGIGGRYGKGVVARRMDDGHWSAPAFVSIGGGSFGAQLGVAAQDLVLVFTDKDAAGTLEKGTSLKLGVDAVAYSRAKGVYARVALDGAVIDLDEDANRKVYGGHADARTILSNPSMATNPAVRDFINALEQAASKRINGR